MVTTVQTGSGHQQEPGRGSHQNGRKHTHYTPAKSLMDTIYMELRKLNKKTNQSKMKQRI